MAGVPNKKMATFAGWPRGIDNKHREDAVAPDSLRAALNVDIDARGKISRRPGFELVDALSGAHSVFASERYPLLLVATRTALYGYDAQLTRTELAALSIDAPMSFASVADKVYYSNGHDSGVLMADGSRRPWAPESPGGQPTLSVNTVAGGLDAGKYQIAVTFLDVYGRESGATLAAEITVEQGQGITLTNFPVPASADIEFVRVYCSPPNGDMLYLAQDVPIVVGQVLIGRHTPGRPLDKQFLQEMPPCTIVRAYAGRLFGAIGRTLIWSEALMYGMYRPSENWRQFESDILMIEPAGEAEGSGLFVATADRTYFLASPQLASSQRTLAASSGAVPNSSVQIDTSSLALPDVFGVRPVWMDASDGMVLGVDGGRMLRLHDRLYAPPTNAEHASLALRHYRGSTHVIAALRGGSTATGMRASDTAEVEVWKAGVRIS